MPAGSRVGEYRCGKAPGYRAGKGRDGWASEIIEPRIPAVRGHGVRAQRKRQLGRTPMYRSRSHRLGATIAIALTASLAIAVGLTTAARAAQAASGTITVAYSKTYVFDADPLSVIWWDNIKKQF